VLPTVKYAPVILISSLGQSAGCSADAPVLPPDHWPAVVDDGGAERLDAADTEVEMPQSSTGGPVRSDTGSGIPSDPGTPCNGEPRLCGLAYDQGILLTTHLSAATSVAGWATVAQDMSFREQLESDVPALMLEVFDFAATLNVCHDDCSSGRTPLSVILEQVK